MDLIFQANLTAKQIAEKMKAHKERASHCWYIDRKTEFNYLVYDHSCGYVSGNFRDIQHMDDFFGKPCPNCQKPIKRESF